MHPNFISFCGFRTFLLLSCLSTDSESAVDVFPMGAQGCFRSCFPPGAGGGKCLPFVRQSHQNRSYCLFQFGAKPERYCTSMSSLFGDSFCAASGKNYVRIMFERVGPFIVTITCCFGKKAKFARSADSRRICSKRRSVRNTCAKQMENTHFDRNKHLHDFPRPEAK